MVKYLILLIIPSLLWAQNRDRQSSGAGNGGDAVICPDGSITLLDSYEQKKNQLTMDLGPGATMRAKVNYVITRLMQKDEFLARKLYSYSMELVDDLELLEAFPNQRAQNTYLGYDDIEEIHDSEERSVGDGCYKRQMISQRTPVFSTDVRYQIDLSYWEKLSVEDKAMGVLHEAWYRIMLEDGATNSIATRTINGIVASREFDSMSFNKYLRDLARTELRHYVLVNTSSAIYDREILVDLKNGLLSFDDNTGFACSRDMEFVTNLKRRTRRREITFPKVCFQNSKIRTIELPVSLVHKRFLRQAINIVLENFYIRISGERSEHPTMHFYPSGKFHYVEGVNIPFMYRMWYNCGDGRKTHERRQGCVGPYWDRDLKYDIDGVSSDLVFDENEFPIGDRFLLN